MNAHAATSTGRSGPYLELTSMLYAVDTLGSIGSLLSWDQETYMPPAGAAHRAEQSAIISALAHERATSPRIGELIAACEREAWIAADPVESRNLVEIRRDYDRATKLPTELVAELARVGSQAQDVWKKAREANDFAMFAPWLDRMMGLTRRKAECLGVPAGGELYDALLDEYEPGATAREIEAVFEPLAPRLSALVDRAGKSAHQPSTAVLGVKIDPSKQHELGQTVLKAMGFDFEAGRLDIAAHPFCTGMAPGDTRLTTRYRGQGFADALFSTMHEGGHGLYEQGLPKGSVGGKPGRFGQPLGTSISLGIHESQSRMWENLVGRSREFWSWLWPQARRIADGTLNAYTEVDAFRAVNIAKPSLIRVDADETTYNLHVMIRFQLERGLIAQRLKVNDLPGEWNRLYKQLLGVDVPDDRRGCLQDVHWSAGLIGYFPTYTLGNLHASQLWETIQRQIPDVKSRIASGQLGALKDWLARNIHAHGRRYRAGELCETLTGAPLGPEPLVRHLESRIAAVYE